MYSIIKTPIGNIKIEENDGSIVRIQHTDEPHLESSNILLCEAKNQLTEYFEGKRKVFDLPLNLAGTEFQQNVWNALKEIPYGETRSYKQIAERIGNPSACRAVGMANNKNPIMIVVPCHRVIGSNGSLTGYAFGTDMKNWLLQLEKSVNNCDC